MKVLYFFAKASGILRLPLGIVIATAHFSLLRGRVHLQEQLKKDPNLAKFKPAALIKAQRRAILANKRKLKQKFEQLDLEDKPRRDGQRIAREKEEAGKLAEEEERRRAYLAEEELREATQEKVPDGGTGVSKDPNLVRDEL